MPIDLDVRTGVITAVIIAGFFALLSLLTGIRAILSGRQIPYFQMRRQRMVTGWRRILLFLFLGAGAYLIYSFAEPVAYSFFPPSVTPTLTPTVSQTPTISLTPTITLSPTITDTPSVSDTPTITPTPHIPLAIEAQFEGEITPPADVVFSRLQFTNQGIDSLYRPVQPGELFTNPVGQMYAYYTYDGMADGVQWTALWFREGELVNFETSPWIWGTGGAGFSEWSPDADDWLAGEYQVQIFIGLDWIVAGSFIVEGTPPTLTATYTETATITPTGTVTSTPTPWPTITSTPFPTPSPTLATPTSTLTKTRIPTATITSTNTPWPTATPLDTRTPRPTPLPTVTPTATITRWPTNTPLTPTPTKTRWPTLTPTP